MKTGKGGILSLCKYLILLAVILGTSIGSREIRYEYYVAAILLFLLNSLLRINYLKGYLFLLSIFIEFGIIYILHSNFSSSAFFLFILTILDILKLQEGKAYPLFALGLAAMIFMLRESGMELLLLSTCIITVVFLLGRENRKLAAKVEEIETLYDQNRRYSYQLEDTKRRLEDYSKRVEKLSQLEERNRISGEIHDTLGHRLTGLLMYLEAAMRVIVVNREEGSEMLQSVRDNLRESIDILRQTVRGMRPKEYSSRALSIEEMLRSFSKETGTDMEFQIKGTPVKLFSGAELALYKNACEAVTNSVQHGKAKKIQVELSFLPQRVELRVRDNGIGCKEIRKGMGISGMEERAALLGGSVEIFSQQGFEVVTVLPMQYEE